MPPVFEGVALGERMAPGAVSTTSATPHHPEKTKLNQNLVIFITLFLTKVLQYQFMRIAKILALTLLVVPACFTHDELGTEELALESDNGLSLNGLSLNGLSLNGLSLNGLSLNGLSLNGLSLSELAKQGSVSFADLSENLQAAVTGNGAKAQLARAFLRYLGKCALPEGSTIVINAGSVDAPNPSLTTRLDKPLVLIGVFGLAAEFPRSSQSGLDRIASCLVGHVNTVSGVAVSLRSEFIGFTMQELADFDLTEGAVSAIWNNSTEAITASLCVGPHANMIPNRNFIQTGNPRSGFVVKGDCAELCNSSTTAFGYGSCGDAFDNSSMLTAFGFGPKITKILDETDPFDLPEM